MPLLKLRCVVSAEGTQRSFEQEETGGEQQKVEVGRHRRSSPSHRLTLSSCWWSHVTYVLPLVKGEGTADTCVFRRNSSMLKTY